MKVELMYFKPESGKFYTSGDYNSMFDEAWEIFNEVKGFRDSGRLPGLRAGAVDFDILVDIPDLYPALLKLDSKPQPVSLDFDPFRRAMNKASQTVKPTVDEEKRGEDIGDLMGLRLHELSS